MPDAFTSAAHSERERRVEGFPPESAALYCAGSSTASSIGGTGHDPFSTQKLGLLEFATEYQLGGIELISGIAFVAQCAEHRVYFDTDNNFAVKITLEGTYGHSAFERGTTASPEEYLRRLSLQNWLFGDSIQIIGITRDTAQIITSQPWVSRTDACTPSEIDEYFAKRGFIMFPIDERDSGHYNDTSGLVILDAHSGNVIKSGNHLFPIDLVIGYPGATLLSRIKDSLQKGL